MADLGNQKIKDTYQLVLQTDTSGNLQNLSGGTPSPFIVNGNLRYADGTQSSGYVLISDGSGNASWGPVAFSGDVYVTGGTIEETTIQLNSTSGGTISIPGLCWSSSTSGHISNSGLTGNVGVGTSTPNEKLTVAGDISGSTDVHVGNDLSVHNDAIINGSLDLIGTDAYIKDGGTTKIALGTPNVLKGGGTAGSWKILDGATFGFDTQQYFTAFRDSGTNRNTLLGKSGGIDLSCTTSNTMNLYSTSVLLGKTAPSQVSVSDVLKVSGDLHVDDKSLYVSASSGRTGIGNLHPTHTLTVSAGTASEGWIAWEDDDMTAIQFTNGVNFLGYGDVGITVPDPLQQEGTSVRVLVGGVYYYGTTEANGGGYGFVNGRGYFGLTWGQANVTLTSGLASVISYGGSQNTNNFAVYNHTGTTPTLQVVGDSVMSGSTDLLDMFASSGITNQDVYWSANTNGSITNSGNTDITTTGNITVTNVNISGTTSYIGAISGTGSITAAGEITAAGGLVGTHANADSAVQPADTFHIGTTSVAHNRGSGALTLAGLTLTTPNIGTPSAGNLGSCTAYPGDSSLVTVGTVTTGVWASNRKFTISTTTDENVGQGDILYFGGGSTTAGDLVYMTTAGQWASAQANATSTSTSMLGIALGTDPDVDGVLLKGTYTLDHDVGNNQGVPLYLSDGTAGQATATIPDSSGDVVRIIGYNLGDDDEIFFDPDKTWVELT